MDGQPSLVNLQLNPTQKTSLVKLDSLFRVAGIVLYIEKGFIFRLKEDNSALQSSLNKGKISEALVLERRPEEKKLISPGIKNSFIHSKRYKGNKFIFTKFHSVELHCVLHLELLNQQGQLSCC